MNTKDFIRLGIPLGEATRRATDFVSQFILSGGTQATKTSEWNKVNAFLREKGVTLISAGLDEVPMVYEVMAAQNDLVTILGQFDPKLVKMAPHGERAEN